MTRSGKLAGVDAPVIHRVHRWTGLGWWRRRAWVKHVAAWYPIAESGGLDPRRIVEACGGDRECIEVRIHVDDRRVPVTGSAFAEANR